MTRRLVGGPGWVIARGVSVGLAWVAVMLVSLATRARGQATAASATLDSAIVAAEAEEPLPPYDQKLITLNDFNWENYTLHLGYNAMYDLVGYSQDPGSVDQWGDL